MVPKTEKDIDDAAVGVQVGMPKITQESASDRLQGRGGGSKSPILGAEIESSTWLVGNVYTLRHLSKCEEEWTDKSGYRDRPGCGSSTVDTVLFEG